jgi:thiamine pyrophosphokinase
MEKRAVIFSGAATPPLWMTRFLPHADITVGVDAGYGAARSLGLQPDLVVGDLDSITAADLAHAEQNNVRIERHPPEKDATDLDLGVSAARRNGATAITLVTDVGDRIDHFLAEVALLSRFELAPLRIDAWIGRAHVSVLHGPATRAIGGRMGELVTLLAVHGPASGVVTTGLQYALSNETLTPGETRGVSNVVNAPPVAVRVQSGCLVVIRPDAARNDA